jgi:hypothetical protein
MRYGPLSTAQLGVHELGEGHFHYIPCDHIKCGFWRQYIDADITASGWVFALKSALYPAIRSAAIAIALISVIALEPAQIPPIPTYL